MAIDPSSLLIFQAREDDKESEDKAKKRKALENTDKPKMLGIFNPPKDTEPMIIEEPKQKTAAQAPSKPLTPREMGRQRTSIFNSSISTIHTAQIESETVQNTNASELMLPGAVDKRNINRNKMMKQQQSRDAARGKTCAWHPWREAFAVCNYCARPFCFQDIIEQNREYYCLEDIDNAPIAYDKIGNNGGSKIAIVAGIALIASFIVFFYFSNAQIIYIFNYVSKSGFLSFISSANYSYLTALAECILVTLGLITGIMLALGSSRASFLGILICIATVAFFSYQYTNTRTFYLLLVDGVVFVAFLLILISRALYTASAQDTTMPLSRFDHPLIKWPNAGRF